LAPLIKLYPSEIFISCCFRKKFLSVQFILLLVFAAFHSIIVQNISVASKKKRKEKNKKKIVQKDVYWILPQKTKQGKIGSNQLRISSNLRI